MRDRGQSIVDEEHILKCRGWPAWSMERAGHGGDEVGCCQTMWELGTSNERFGVFISRALESCRRML